MKKPQISLMVCATFVAFAFVLGLWFGRNSIVNDLTISVSEEIPALPPTHSSEMVGSNSENLSLININTATAEELSALPGIGTGLADQIIAFRESTGNFTYVEELLNVPGIGETRLEAILGMITTGG